MRSTALPPELATIAREATRNGDIAPAPPRTARILGLGHHVPPEVVPNGPIAERIGVDDAWIVKRTGIKSRRRALPDERLTDYADVRRPPRADRRRRRPARRRPRARRDDDAGRDHAERRAASWRNALGAENAGAIDIGAACTGWLAALRAGRRPGRDRPRRPRARDRRRAAHAHHRLRRPEDRDAVRRRRRRRARRLRRRGRHRPDRDGRRRLAGRPHHRLATTSACWRWTATRPTRSPSSA